MVGLAGRWLYGHDISCPYTWHAASGRVAVASFAEHAVASVFARSWSRLLGRSVVVRPGPVIGGQVRSWRVSVPIALWPSSSAGQLLVRGGGGIRGVAASLRALGFVSAAA
jgi:hypothetical protein